MKKIILGLAFLLAFAFPANATNFTDTDQVYGWNTTTSAQFYQTWAEHKAQLDVLYQPLSAALTTYAGIDPSANVQSFLGAADYAAMRTALGVDAAGTDNSTNVTLAGTPDYITITGQEITRNTIVATTDLSATGTKDSTTFLRGDDTWATPSGASPLTTKGDLYTYDTANARLPVGVNGYVLCPDSSQTTGLNWCSSLAVDIILEDASATTDGQLTFDGTLNQLELGVDGSSTVTFSNDTTNAASYEAELNNSAGLLAALSDETGTGVAVFSTSPTLVTPNIGVASATSIASTGTITGLVSVVSKATSASLSATEVSGTLVLVTAATQTMTLPTAVSGYSTCVMLGQGVTGTLTVTPATGDYLVLDGVRGTAATAYTATSAAGNKICLIAANADDWYITSKVGTWSE